MNSHFATAHSLTATGRPQNLAEAVEHARHPRNRATVKLAPHRDELLRLRRAGQSVETLALALSALDVQISREALRTWLNREMGHAPRKRTKRRQASLSAARLMTPPTADGAATASTSEIGGGTSQRSPLLDDAGLSSGARSAR